MDIKPHAAHPLFIIIICPSPFGIKKSIRYVIDSNNQMNILLLASTFWAEPSNKLREHSVIVFNPHVDNLII